MMRDHDPDSVPSLPEMAAQWRTMSQEEQEVGAGLRPAEPNLTVYVPAMLRVALPPESRRPPRGIGL